MLLQPLLLIPLFKHFRVGLKNTLHGVNQFSPLLMKISFIIS